MTSSPAAPGGSAPAPAAPTRLAFLVGAVALGLALLGGALLREAAEPDPEQGPTVPAAFAAYVWSGGGQADFDAAWQGGTAPPMLQTREVQGPSSIAGRPHHHVAWVVPGRRRKVAQEAWYRPSADGSSWLCARRRIGGTLLDLEPPLPILKAPLQAQATWDWEGRVGERPASARFEVLRAEEGLLVVRQSSRLAGGETTITRTYQAGRGLIREEGAFPYEPRGDTAVVTRPQESPGALEPWSSVVLELSSPGAQ